MSLTTDNAAYDPSWVLNAIANGLVVLDKDQRVVTWNRWMEQHSDIAQANILGQKIAEFCPEIKDSRIALTINSAIEHRMSSLITPALHQPVLKLYQAQKDRTHDRRMQQLIHIVPMTVNNGAGCLLQIQDMTATVKRERRLRMHADQIKASSYLDALTGLYNRRKFNEILDAEFDKAKQSNTPLSLLMIDIDCFKLFVEHYGQHVSDNRLAQISRSIRESLHQTSDVAFRFSPEKIAVLLPGHSENSASIFAERTRVLVESLKIQHKTSKVGNYVSISVGVSTASDLDKLDAQTLIQAADMALYHAKSDGRNRAMCFSLVSGNIRACF